ncbi:related to ceramide glucosyltransferase [Rhynchosporium graminicola]|uniref:Ceramide glucosyltransferase n=1 Tax=Rhynchosporium graminicola TaxID=2792576 RepID=A0A1E1KY41_9HELO|nr:related to ceramide glucosyltransferase [Rhynchosporium commune]
MSSTLQTRGDGGQDYEISLLLFAVCLACAIWYFFVTFLQAVGFAQLYRNYSSKPKPATSPALQLEHVPHVTIIRPVKGLEPQLYECLAATFHQTYPLQKLTIYFCVASMRDPAFPVLKRLLANFPHFDAKIFIEEEDPKLSGHGGERLNLGPNPKIRNMSRAYREVKGDLVWVLDSNVWVGKGVAGRMVDKLCGYQEGGKRGRPYKFVHQLPLVVDNVGASGGGREEARSLQGQGEKSLNKTSRSHGGRFEEMFMATSHAKFYTAINTIAVAPCIVGKSNMFRRSHLDDLTSCSPIFAPGIDYFSENICEDHLIGDLIWRKQVQDEIAGEKFHKHGLVFGDLAIQPMAGIPVREYIGRRVRWLRVRKWTVTLATFVEPGVEPLLCSAYGAFAVTTLPYFAGIPHTWTSFWVIWLASVLAWMSVDYLVYARLHSCTSVELDENTPSFAMPPKKGRRRSFGEWLFAWLGRELLALPIWLWACYGGTTVLWRGKAFRVGLDMRVKEIKMEERRKN